MKIAFIKHALFLGFLALLSSSCKSSNPISNENTIPSNIHVWSNVTNGLPRNVAYKIAAVKKFIYLYTTNYKLYSSSNNGESWNIIGTGLPDSTWISGIVGIQDYLVAATEGKGIFISSDMGANWTQPLNKGLNSNTDYVHSINANSQYIFIGAGLDASVYRSSDFGDTWTSFSSGFPPTTQQYYPRISLLVQQDTILFACPFSSGIYFSNNDGANWQSTSQGFPYLCTINNFAVSDSFYFVTITAENEQGLFRRSFNEVNWIKMPNKIMDSNLHFVVAQNRTVLVSTNSGIEISFDNGRIWNVCNKGLDDSTFTGFSDAIISNNYVFAIDNYHAVWRYSLQ